MPMPLSDGEFEQLHAQPAPRDAALCASLARRLEPTGGFVVYFVLWLLIGGLGLAFVPALIFVVVAGVTMSADARAHSSLLVIAFPLLGLAGELLCWWLFLRFVRGRRAATTALVSDGTFVEATASAP